MNILEESRMMLELAISSLQRAGHDTEQFEKTVSKIKALKQNTIPVVSGSTCSKCGMSGIDMKFQCVETKIYWSEHDEIENIKKFTRNDRYYTSDKTTKECLVHKCKTCGYKKAVAVSDS
jgi:hypothetical protein